MTTDFMPRLPLSQSTDGRNIKIAGTTAGTATAVHTASATVDDEVWLYASNTSASDCLITALFGGTTEPDDCIDLTIPSKAGAICAVPGFVLTNSLTVKVFAAVANVIVVNGFCRRPVAAGSLLHLRDEKSSGTDGGTFTSGSWQTRTLNTVTTNDIPNASLSSNQISLPAGTYRIEGSAPARAVKGHQTRLQDTTNSETLIIGTSENTDDTNGIATPHSFIRGSFTLDATTELELQHRCTQSFSGTGFGFACGFNTEIYSEVMIWQTG